MIHFLMKKKRNQNGHNGKVLCCVEIFFSSSHQRGVNREIKKMEEKEMAWPSNCELGSRLTLC